MREKDSFALAVQTMRLREKKRRLRLLAGRALLMLFIAWLLSFVFGIFVVQGDSMRPAYQDGDLVFMIRVLPKGVTYDNVVILEDAEGKEILKRIVGLPGDTITLYDNGRLYAIRSQCRRRTSSTVQHQAHMADLHSTGERILLLRGQPPGIERQQTERLRR